MDAAERSGAAERVPPEQTRPTWTKKNTHPRHRRCRGQALHFYQVSAVPFQSSRFGSNFASGSGSWRVKRAKIPSNDQTKTATARATNTQVSATN